MSENLKSESDGGGGTPVSELEDEEPESVAELELDSDELVIVSQEEVSSSDDVISFLRLRAAYNICPKAGDTTLSCPVGFQ